MSSQRIAVAPPKRASIGPSGLRGGVVGDGPASVAADALDERSAPDALRPSPASRVAIRIAALILNFALWFAIYKVVVYALS
jgi:hypothetical protein